MNNHSNTAMALSKIYTNPLSTAQQKQQQQSHSRSCLQFNSQGSASSTNAGQQMPQSKSPITSKTDPMGQKVNNFGATQKHSKGQAQQLKGLHQQFKTNRNTAHPNTLQMTQSNLMINKANLVHVPGQSKNSNKSSGQNTGPMQYLLQSQA